MAFKSVTYVKCDTHSMVDDKLPVSSAASLILSLGRVSQETFYAASRSREVKSCSADGHAGDHRFDCGILARFA